MVSQPDPAPSLAIRGTSSLVSRPSARSKRYNRSTVGAASSYLPQNEFPVFSHSGDVEILIRAGSVENRYLLHRHTLTRCSGFFEASTSVEWSRAQPLLPSGHELSRIGEDGGEATDTEHAAPRKKWRYELDSGSGPNDIPMLVQRDEPREDPRPMATASLFGQAPKSSRSSHHKSSSYSHSSKRDYSRSVMSLGAQPQTLSQADEDLLRDYDNLFRTFYNYPPVLDSINVADAYVQCKSLLTLADQYDALAVIGPRVDHHLLQFQSRLWKQIAKYPISYLRLGYLARSKVIFQEALIHVVGQWPAGERSLRATMPDIVLDIIEDKVDELEETVSRVEGRLFRLNLNTSRGERVTPNNGYLDWLATSLFRQWIADNTTPQPPPEYRHRPGSRENRPADPPPPPPAPPALTSVGRAYRTLGSDNPDTFLGHDECKKFLKLTPEFYSRENLRRFEKRMDELKAMARSVVRPLMNSGLELDLSGSSRVADSIAYLTCTEVGNRDLPWSVDE
ncbi:hypothetical protein ACSS6W_010554 [Trichoderma asperelloides]|uniref:BTB domain-containing protein n=1 Tax=Trichoderma asperellum TaxID=101201 RepID=A0A6V8QYS2_TRIAP|nr:hypothetical protein LI328DRAFT_74985 [Trichoderma asperelloides]GFP57202.1 hypothetical protein TASIC1_0008004300 [Trichoderma asperellum]